MNEKLVRAKQHVQEHKELYIGLAVGVAVTAVAGTVLFRKTVILNGDGVVMTGQFAKHNPTTINLLERSTPSKPVHLLGTNLYFSSIGEAARTTGHQASMISKNVAGKIADVKGDVFVPLELAA